MDTVMSERIGFNTLPPTLMHVDLNSCFATIEQQANPLLRGKPVAVAAYTTPGGCILAASYEAKRFGVKTGLRVREGKMVCPGLIILPSDPWKYRWVNRKLLALFSVYTATVEVKSIDEMVLDFERSPALERHVGPMPYENVLVESTMQTIAKEIKRKIKEEVGEWLTVSVGIAPNRYLAKVAAGLHKPDGLDVISKVNIETILESLSLEDLCGIKAGYGGRLRRWGIGTALAFYKANIRTLKSAFHSINGYYWWLRLHGWEADDREFAKKSVGHSYALYEPYRRSDPRLSQILCQLTEKMGRRLRSYGARASGMHVWCLLGGYASWHHGESLGSPIYSNKDLYDAAQRILKTAPNELVRNIAVSCFCLTFDLYTQLTLDESEVKKEERTRAIDAIHDRWGGGLVTSARLLKTPQRIKDRIAFGGVKDLEEFIFQDKIRGEYTD